MKLPQKRMIYHFYVSNEWDTSITNKIHFACLKKYAHIFNEVIICLSIDNIEDKETIKNVELFFLDLGLSPNITFKIIENSYLRDAETFYNEIVLKLGDYDGLTFFAHNKGTTNLKTMAIDEVSKWITSLYYFSLEYVDEMAYLLTDGREMSYGPLLVAVDYNELPEIFDDGTSKYDFIDRANVLLGKNKYFYMGTFFWLNTLTINDYIKKNNIEIPQLSDRWYAENFCANIYPLGFAFSHNGKYSVNYLNGGVDINTLINQIATESEKNAFEEFNKSIINGQIW